MSWIDWSRRPPKDPLRIADEIQAAPRRPAARWTLREMAASKASGPTRRLRRAAWLWLTRERP